MFFDHWLHTYTRAHVHTHTKHTHTHTVFYSTPRYTLHTYADRNTIILNSYLWDELFAVTKLNINY